MNEEEPLGSEGSETVEDASSATTAATTSAPSHIVCLGASAGGLEALQTFFSEMQADSGAAFVVVLHLSPDFKSLMPELISRHTAMQIRPASEGTRLERDWIYIIPPGKNMVYEGGQLHLHDQDRTPGHALNLPIDIFLNSVAQESGDNAIGIILSGTGSDGSRGVRALKDAGGIVMAQDPESASFDGMPRSVLETGVVDACGPPAELASLVAKVTRQLHSNMSIPEHADTSRAEDLNPVLEQMRAHFSLDLSYLRSAMLQRRVRRRMALLSIRTLPNYVERLRDDVKEAVALRRDVFIGVTGFFRDEKSFEFIRTHLATSVFNKPETEPIRIWVPACASGEEVYSLAMITIEVLEELGGDKRDVKIFATDIDEEALARASRGVYSSSNVADISPRRLTRFFDNHNGVFTVKPALREIVICAKHNLVTDPPFKRVDLVSCRNFLIYLDQESQERVLASLHFSLRENGTLFLGQAEALGRLENEFATIHQRHKVFQKSRNVILPPMRRRSGLQDPISIVPRQPRRTADREAPIREVLDAMIAFEGQAAALATIDGSLLEILGDPIGIFHLPKGKPTNDIVRLVTRELAIPLTTGLQRLKRNETELRYSARLTGDTGSQVKLKLKKIEAPDAQLERVLILVEPISTPDNERANSDERRGHEETDRQMQELQLELQQTRETLQATIEELQSSNEEQQSTNEELVASNEELQSTNEELQSVNEELFTVNAEYQNKIQELAVLAADLDNLLRNIDVGTLFLDQDLRIRKFTPAIDRVIKLVEHDIGRPIEHFAHNLGTDLLEDVSRVMETGVQVESEVRSTSGSWLLVRILPYMTHAGPPDGVVMTVVDVTPIKNAQQMTRVTNDQLAHANVELSRQREELEDLFSIVAHDLKRPVVALDGLLKIVKGTDSKDASEETEDFVARAIVECQRMGRMLEDLSSLSAATRREHTFEEIDLEPWLDGLIERFRPVAAERGVQFNCTSDSGIVRVPRSALEESLVNLLENALNYGSGNATPRIDVACRMSDGILEVSVRDNGQGISQDNHHKVFEPFRRLDPQMAEGSGVGLVAVRRLIGRHGGIISLDSSAQKGAKFTVRLPIDRGQSPIQISQNSRKVLVVEDDVLDAKAIERSIGNTCTVTRAKDLASAMTMLGQAHFDAIVLDLSLPDGHGLELIHYLRMEMEMDTPVVVVTGHGEGITPSMMTATVSGFVSKSEIRGDTLRVALTNAIESEAGPDRRTVFAPSVS